MTVAESSSRVPVCATLGRAGLRAGTCAVRRGARVTPPVTDTSVAPQDNFPPWPWEKRQSRLEPPHLSGSPLINGRQHTTINDNHLSVSPPLRRTAPEDCHRARIASGRTVHTCTHVWKEEDRRHASCHTRVDFARANTRRANYRVVDYRSRRRASQAGRATFGPSFARCFPRRLWRSWRGADRLFAKTQRANRCRVVSRNRELRAANTRSYHRPESPAPSCPRNEKQRGLVSLDNLEDSRSIALGTTLWVPFATGTPRMCTIYLYVVKGMILIGRRWLPRSAISRVDRCIRVE